MATRASVTEAPAAGRWAEPQLPVYTVLVPLLREASVVPELLDLLRALDYPAGRLEVMLIVECAEADAVVCGRRHGHDLL